jgi:hypothetical protein
LHGRTVSEKLPKIPLFGPSLIHQLRLLESSVSVADRPALKEKYYGNSLFISAIRDI